jgi:hypothetical protein
VDGVVEVCAKQSVRATLPANEARDETRPEAVVVEGPGIRHEGCMVEIDRAAPAPVTVT